MKAESIGIGRIGPESSIQRPDAQHIKSGEFDGLLSRLQEPKMTPAQPKETTGGLKFSRHALERMHSRGISFPREIIDKMEEALTRAQQKGAKDTLILSGDKALIVNAKTSTVVTVMDKSLMGENIVTNIDSTIML